MKELLVKYEKSGFKIIVCPSNQFGAQEPWELPKIKTWTEEQFQLPQTESFQHTIKMNVNGDDTHPLYNWLRELSGKHGDVKWNFFSAFLVSKMGVVTRHNSFRWKSLGSKIQGLVNQEISETEI